MFKKILTLFLFLQLSSSVYSINYYYVDTNATGLNNGTSWADAYTNLKIAMASAIAPAEIWVAQGTYFPSTLSSDNYVSFHMMNGVTVYGGFNATETLLSQRNPSLYVTTLSGDLDHSGTFTGGDAYHVVFAQNEDSTAVFDGFRITGGNAQGGNIWDLGGGGFSHQPSSGGYLNPIVRNCVFDYNSASSGAAISIINWNVPSSNVLTQIINCKIINSAGYYNGAIFTECQGSGSYISSKFENLLIANNACSAGGYAAIYIEHANGGSSNVTFTGCTFANNNPNGGSCLGYRTYGGGGSCTLNNCIFYGQSMYTDAFFSGNNNDLPYFGAVSGSGNISTDPLYVNPGSGDYRLQCSSPCIEAGSNTYTHETTDLNGNARITATNVDIGAYETNYGAPPAVSANATLSTVCFGGFVTLTGAGAVTYTWDNGVIDGVPFAAGSTTTYNVTGTDANGCTGTANITVTVNTLPPVLGTATSTSVCQGDMVTLTGSGAQSYSWDNGVTDGVGFNATSTTTYIVSGTDLNGCVNTSTVTVIVNPLPFVGANASSTNICIGSPVTLSGSGANFYSWDNGVIDGTPFSPAVTTTYNVTGIDFNGCVGISSVTVNVNSLPNVSATSSVPAVCPGAKVTLFGLGAFTYSWTNGVINANPFYPAATATYTVTGTDANGCTDTSSITVTVYSAPSPGVVTMSPNDSICLGTNLVYTIYGASSSALPLTYNLYYGGFTTSGPDSTLTWAPSVSELDSVWVTDANGCNGPGTSYNIYVYPNTDIAGHVTYSGGDLINATAYLIKQGTLSATYDTLGTTVTDGLGMYLFSNLLAGNYYVKIIPQAGNPNLIDTYFGNVYLWDSAMTVTHGCIASSSSTDITMVEILPAGGTGTISGTVYEGIGFGQRLAQDPGNPTPFTNVIPGVPVKVGKNPGGSIVAQGTTDVNGQYNFTNLPLDNYRIYTDIPGYPMDSSYAITLSSGSSSAVNLDYFVDSNSVYIDITTAVQQQIKSVNVDLALFPNPSQGKVFVKLPAQNNPNDNNCTLIITDALGNRVFSKNTQLTDKGTQTEMDLSHLSAGVYSLTLLNGSSAKSVKVILSK